MDATKGNGTTAGNSHPAEILTKRAADFTSTPRLTATFPARHNTVTAEVLSRLIKGETLTGMDAVFCANTTRLSAVIFYLNEDYGWSIEHLDIDVGTNDGRVASIRAYYLSSASIRQAFADGAREFCDSVTVARAMRRKLASKVKADAARRNAARAAHRFNPNQGVLFKGGEL